MVERDTDGRQRLLAEAMRLETELSANADAGTLKAVADLVTEPDLPRDALAALVTALIELLVTIDAPELAVMLAENIEVDESDLWLEGRRQLATSFAHHALGDVTLAIAAVAPLANTSHHPLAPFAKIFIAALRGTVEREKLHRAIKAIENVGQPQLAARLTNELDVIFDRYDDEATTNPTYNDIKPDDIRRFDQRTEQLYLHGRWSEAYRCGMAAESIRDRLPPVRIIYDVVTTMLHGDDLRRSRRLIAQDQLVVEQERAARRRIIDLITNDLRGLTTTLALLIDDIAADKTPSTQNDQRQKQVRSIVRRMETLTVQLSLQSPDLQRAPLVQPEIIDLIFTIHTATDLLSPFAAVDQNQLLIPPRPQRRDVRYDPKLLDVLIESLLFEAIRIAQPGSDIEAIVTGEPSNREQTTELQVTAQRRDQTHPTEAWLMSAQAIVTAHGGSIEVAADEKLWTATIHFGIHPDTHQRHNPTPPKTISTSEYSTAIDKYPIDTNETSIPTNPNQNYLRLTDPAENQLRNRCIAYTNLALVSPPPNEDLIAEAHQLGAPHILVDAYVGKLIASHCYYPAGYYEVETKVAELVAASDLNLLDPFSLGLYYGTSAVRAVYRNELDLARLQYHQAAKISERAEDYPSELRYITNHSYTIALDAYIYDGLRRLFDSLAQALTGDATTNISLYGAILLIGDSEQVLETPQATLEDYETLLANTSPEQPRHRAHIYRRFAELHRAAGNAAEAEEAMDALRDSPTDTVSTAKRAFAEADHAVFLGNDDEAEHVLRNLLANDPDISTAETVWARILLGRIYIRNRRYDELIGTYDATMFESAFDCYRMVMHRHLATAHAETKNLQLAAKHIATAAALGRRRFKMSPNPIISPIPLRIPRLVMQTDIAERANRQLTELRLGMRRLDQSVAHDLKTPITTLALGLNQQIDPQIAEIASIAIGRINKILEDLVAEPDIHARDLTPTTIAIAPLFAEMADSYYTIANHRSINLQFTQKGHPNYLKCIANHSALTRAIENILSNALKFTPDNGTVKVIATGLGRTLVEIAIVDTGPGIPLELHELIFEWGISFDGQPNDSSGYGLNIARSLVEAMNGRVRVFPGAKGGTVFTIILPRAT